MAKTAEFEVEVKVSPKCFWAALKDSGGLLSKIKPHIFSSCKHTEGVEGTPGAVRLMKFGSGSDLYVHVPAFPENAFVKEKLISIDHDKYELLYAEVEGGHLSRGYTKFQINLNLTPGADEDSTIVNWHAVYELNAAANTDCGNKQSIDEIKDEVKNSFKDMESYLLSTTKY